MDHPQTSLPMQKKDKPCSVHRSSWLVYKGARLWFLPCKLSEQPGSSQTSKDEKSTRSETLVFLGEPATKQYYIPYESARSLQEIEITQTLHEPYPPPPTTTTSLSPISSSIPKPFDGKSSVPSFLSPPLRSHNFSKSSKSVTGRVDTRVYHQSIPVRITNRFKYSKNYKGRVASVLKTIYAEKSGPSVLKQIPVFMVLNARSVAKPDASVALLHADLKSKNVDICCISETWLKDTQTHGSSYLSTRFYHTS